MPGEVVGDGARAGRLRRTSVADGPAVARVRSRTGLVFGALTHAASPPMASAAPLRHGALDRRIVGGAVGVNAVRRIG